MTAEQIQQDALQAIQQAVARVESGEMPLLELVEFAGRLGAAGLQGQTVRLYRSWLARTTSPHAFVAWFNLGVLLADAGDGEGAIAAYRHALALNPGFAQARINLGRQLEAAGEADAAIAEWTLAAAGDVAQEFVLLALNNVGRLCEQLGRLQEAEDALARSLQRDPEQPDVIQHWVHLRQKQCHWPVCDTARVPASANAMLLATSPLAMLAQCDDPAMQLMAARSFVQRKFAPVPENLAAGRKYGHQKLRVGYLGGNLCVHAVGLLLADVLECQDRTRFESYAYCYSPEDGSAYRQRLLAAFDHVERVAALDDAQLAHKILADEIDILVDLHSLSDGVRAGVLARRPAPVQLSWLGFIGPSAMPWLDGVVADRYALPESLLPYYGEKPLYLSRGVLPLCKRPAPEQAKGRADFGLPEGAFVFANFNNAYKLNPDTFAGWMRILRATPGSVLWLLADKDALRATLLQEAGRHGVGPERIVFAGRVAVADYLARFRCADLFLDNYPYNAGSTACDALGSGLPLLTLSGQTFVSRMAGALLDAIGLHELIAHSRDAYEKQAIALATEPTKLGSLKARLSTALAQSAACDPSAYMRDFESLLDAWRPEVADPSH